MAWTDRLSDQQRKEIAWSRMYAESYGHFTDGHSRLMLISLLAELLDQVEGELQIERLRAPEPASTDWEALDTKILMDIADWSGRHGLTLSETALIDALQRVRDVHYQRLFVEEQLAALGWRPGGVNDPALLLARARDDRPPDELERAHTALRMLLAEPYGCSLCDSGTPRNLEKGHQPDCPYEFARAILAGARAQS